MINIGLHASGNIVNIVLRMINGFQASIYYIFDINKIAGLRAIAINYRCFTR